MYSNSRKCLTSDQIFLYNKESGVMFRSDKDAPLHQASCLKTKKATSLPAFHWKHFTFTFPGHFQGCLFVKATENQLHHIKSGKKDIAYCSTLSANQLQVSKILKYAVHDCLMLPSTVKTSFAHFWPPRCR